MTTIAIPPEQQLQAFKDAVQLMLTLALRSFASWDLKQVKQFHHTIDTLWTLVRTEPEKRTPEQLDDAWWKLASLREQLHPDAIEAFDRMVRVAKELISNKVNVVEPSGGKHR